METENPTYRLILSELARLNVAQNLQTDNEVLAEKALIFADEAETADLEDIRAAIRAHGRENRWLPALSEFLERLRFVREERRRQTRALPMPPELSDEQVALNLAKIKELKTTLGMSMTMPDKPTINSIEKLQAQAQALLRGKGKNGKDV